MVAHGDRVLSGEPLQIPNHGKVPTDMFGKPCTWGGAQGWLDSRMEPHIVVRDAARTASRAQNRQMKQQQRAIASKERHQRKQQQREHQQQLADQRRSENERREQEKEEKRRRKLELRDDDAHHERQMQWRRERRLRWDEEESTARRCQGVCVSGTQCRVYSCHPGAHAAPLKRGATFCLHHRKQTAVPMQLYMNGVGLDVEAVVHD